MLSGDTGLFVGRQDCILCDLVFVLHLDFPASGDSITLLNHLTAFHPHSADIRILF